MKYRILGLFLALCLFVLGFGAAGEEVFEEGFDEGFDMSATPEIDLLAVDHKLYELGYRDGACNGVLDEITVNALCKFQIVNGLEPTGEADQNTVSLLFSSAAVSQQDYITRLAQEYAAMPALANGSYGEGVSKLQHELKVLGYFPGTTDGKFGNETESAVYRFQLANGLQETGVADAALFIRLYSDAPVTWDAFLHQQCASVGDSGAKVRTLQVWLSHKGYFNGECTGRYGEATQKAVTLFQLENGLESSGDADLETCRALYWDVHRLVEERYALRPGDSGSRVDLLCGDLATLGYPAHGSYDMQTELALMQFQLVNGMEVSGVADLDTVACMRSESARRIEDYEAPANAMPDEENTYMRIYRQAAAQLGRFSQLESDFGFVQYVALKCGAALMEPGQLAVVEADQADNITPGMLMGARVDGRDIYGIAASGDAMIFRDGNGYIVMGYLDAMGAESSWIYRVIEEE